MMEPSVDRLPERRLVRRENSSGVVGGDAPHDSTGAMTGLLSMGSQRFAVTVVAVGPDSLLVPVPFNPNVVWGTKPRHHIAGTVSGIRVRATSSSSTIPTQVTVDIAPEGPKRDDLAEDIAEALAANPAAGAFFDSLAQFYRRAYLRWIEATKRRPEQRPARIAEIVILLESGSHTVASSPPDTMIARPSRCPTATAFAQSVWPVNGLPTAVPVVTGENRTAVVCGQLRAAAISSGPSASSAP